MGESSSSLQPADCEAEVQFNWLVILNLLANDVC